ncbi:MAG: PA domain-containing protein [Bryobacteraceae bacterium]
MSNKRQIAALWGVALLAAAMPAGLQAAATIVIVNNDGPGEGFNDPTPVAPVGGNSGTTLGQQRLIAFQSAADVWGASLTSNVTIPVRANFDPLTCTATSAVLGSAGPITVSRDFTNAPLAGTWYHAALANKRFGSDIVAAEPDIAARFNSNLGQANCLTGVFFYLGLDNNHGTNIDLVTVVLHEFGHGLGFSTTTNGSTGAQLQGFPSSYDHFLLDLTTSLGWTAMTNAERAASAINARKVVWTGPQVTAAVPTVLSLGTPELGVVTVGLPVNVTGTYLAGRAQFGAALSNPGVTSDLMPVVSQLGGTGPGCEPFNAVNTVAVNGRIALIDRGVCSFIIKVKNAQNAGAVGVVIADNVAGSPPPDLGGVDPTITIPSVRITLADGNTLKTALRYRSRTKSGVVTTLRLNTAIRSGADAGNRMLVYTPNPFQSGSSVSHWDTSAFPNLLMEPAINADLTHSVSAPSDLTLEMLRDIGWIP